MRLDVKITAFFLLFTAFKVEARSIDAFYMDPFDIGAGGTSLTNATQEGILANNPAQLPYGSKSLRWLGSKTTISPGEDSISLAGSMGKQSGGEGTSLLDQLFLHPIHLGVCQTLSMITKYAGFAAVASTAPDIRAWKYGDPNTGAGTPNIVIQNETYAGIYGSLASKTPYRFLTLAATAKYFLADERRQVIDLTDREAAATIQKKITEFSLAKADRGLGIDVASLIFLQGNYTDLRFGLTLQNVGGMKMAGDNPRVYQQVINAGTSFTLHSESSAIHFMADYRDILNAEKNGFFNQMFLGTKVLLFTFVGLAAGVYQGAPTYGVELDLLLLRLAATTYIREYGSHPGVDQRRIDMISISMGLSF